MPPPLKLQINRHNRCAGFELGIDDEEREEDGDVGEDGGFLEAEDEGIGHGVRNDVEEVAEEHEVDNVVVVAPELRPNGQGKVGGYLVNHVGGYLKIDSLEKYPAKAHKKKGEQLREQVVDNGFVDAPKGFSGHLHPYFVYGECAAVHGSPGYKSPVGAVPEPAEEHGDEQVQVGAEFTLPVAPEPEDIQVIFQPTGE